LISQPLDFVASLSNGVPNTYLIMSDERNYFSQRFIQKASLSFTYPTQSAWQIVHKISENYRQLGEWNFRRNRVPAAAEGLFLCAKEGDPDQQAHMRVYMQIPYQGTEYEGREELERQAIDEAGETLFSEVKAFKAQREKQSRFTPTLLGYKQEKQDDSGIIPGGFICYLIWKPLDGLRLGTDSVKEPYWTLSPEERAEIREAFRAAYEYVYN
jgi:hypothetical protein